MSEWSAHLVPRKDADFDLYPYNPSAIAAYTFVGLFAAGGFWHIICMVYFRTWNFIPLILGCAGEVLGYYYRAQSHDHIRHGGPYLIQLMLILVSPPLFSATVYMTLGRLMNALDAAHYSLISTRWLTKMYVFIDVACFLCQLAGSAMQSSGDPAGAKTGQQVVVGGLVFQMIAFAFFVIIALRFYHRMKREPTVISEQEGMRWRRHIVVLCVVSVLVSVRNIFRIVEFAGGNTGKVYTTEAYLYVLDASLMLLLVVLMGVVHPGTLLKLSRRIKKEGKRESGAVDEVLLAGQNRWV